ncbi:MAG: ChbG/HpnK family deacetylase [Planctomycetaceae bacterium]|nr:ChbG/HpnK family deacetylase [Planctomycetaceae bacterium]
MKRVALYAGLWLWAMGASNVAAQTNWGERLGFPPGRRVVILHANDMGIAYEFNRPVETGLQEGRLTSASCLSVGPWFAECVEWVQANRDKDVGLALSFVSPSRAVQWGPVAPCDKVPSLTTADGQFPPTTVQFMLRADVDQVRREAAAQLDRARRAGIKPSHLHPHLGAILTRIDLLQVYLDLAQEAWIPAVMVDFTPELVECFHARGIHITAEMIDAVARYPLPKIDDIQNVPPADTYEETRERFCDVIRSLKPGITEVFLNPADDTPALRRMNDKWQQRVWEAQLLADPTVPEFLQQEQIILTDWREIMQRFETVRVEREVEEE